MKKRFILAISTIFILLIALSANASGYEKKEEIRKKFSFPAKGSLKLQNRNGDIFIRSWEKEIVEMKAVKWVESSSARWTDSFFQRLKLRIEEHPGKLAIKVEYPDNYNRRRWIFGSRDIEFRVDFELYVPGEINLDLYSRNGEINVEGIEGRTKVESRNGDVTLNNIRGKLNIYSRNGKLKMEKVCGSLQAETRNDDIIVDFCPSPLEGEVSICSRNGRIRVTFPQDLSADISIATQNGSINSHFPIEIMGKIKKGHLEGSINQGGLPIKLETRNGNIDIYKY